MNRTLVGATSVLLAGALSAGAIDKIRIAATKKTGSERSGKEQDLPDISARATSSEVHYLFTLQRATTDMPEKANVEWVIVVERMAGQLVPAAYGSKDVELPLGRPVDVASDPVTLQGWEWQRDRRGTGKVAEDVYGYAVRVRGADGRILAEKYNPKSLETDVERIIQDWQKRKDEFRETFGPARRRPGPPVPPALR